MLDPTEFFTAVAEYDKSASNDASKGHARCATVDSAYAGTGPARVTFDGEVALTTKAYHFLNLAPQAGARVCMMPIANTYVIAGMLDGGA
jgi:hypothetical protein